MKHWRFVAKLALVALSIVPLVNGSAVTRSISTQRTKPLISAQNQNGVPVEITDRLVNGVNVTRWFCYQGNSIDLNHFKDYLKDDDFAVFKKLNVSFVRLCLSPDIVIADGKLNATVAPSLDDGLKLLHSHHLVTIFDLHDNGQLKLDSPGQDNSGFISFWKDAAAHYKGQYEKSMVFELVNEPVFQKNPEVWFKLQEQAVGAIREVDPDRTIMCSGTSWSGIDNLAQLIPVAESNIVYTSHCYDPFQFTHQGASWVGEGQHLAKNIPFPSSPEAVAAIIDDLPASIQGQYKDYGSHNYGQQYLNDRLAKAMSWANQYHVPMVLGEFGSYPPVAPVQSRRNWFMMMRHAITVNRIPNSIWGYDDAMGLGRTRDDSGKLVLDQNTLKAFYGQ